MSCSGARSAFPASKYATVWSTRSVATGHPAPRHQEAPAAVLEDVGRRRVEAAALPPAPLEQVVVGEREAETDQHPEETAEDTLERRGRVEASRLRAHTTTVRVGNLHGVCIKALIPAAHTPRPAPPLRQGSARGEAAP